MTTDLEEKAEREIKVSEEKPEELVQQGYVSIPDNLMSLREARKGVEIIINPNVENVKIIRVERKYDVYIKLCGETN